MRMLRLVGETQQRQAEASALDRAWLAQVRGGLKAERVQGSDPDAPGGD